MRDVLSGRNVIETRSGERIPYNLPTVMYLVMPYQMMGWVHGKVRLHHHMTKSYVVSVVSGVAYPRKVC